MIKVLFGVCLLSFHVQAMQLKDLKVNGTGCIDPIFKKSIELSTKNNHLNIPLKSEVTLISPLNLERKVCQFSMTLSLKPHEKIQISDVQQKINLDLTGETEATSELSIYLAGKSNKLAFNDIQKVENETLKNKKTLGSLTEKLESECGRDVILRGSLSLLLTSKNATQAIAKSAVQADELFVKIDTKSCL